jgi:phage shock protein A
VAPCFCAQARAASAKTSQQIQEMMAGLNTSNAVVAFEKMEQKVRNGSQACVAATLAAGDPVLALSGFGRG